MPSLKKGFAHLFLVVVLAVACVGALGYYAYKNGQIKLIPKSNSNYSPTPTITPNLQFFSDEKFNISFFHPEDLAVEANWDGGGEDPTVWWRILMFYKERTEDNLDFAYIDILEQDNPRNLNPSQWFELHKNKYNDLGKSIAELTLDGLPAKIIGFPSTCKSAPGFVVFIQNKNKVLTLTHFVHTPSEKYVDILKTILKTFSSSSEPIIIENQVPDFGYVTPPNDIQCD